MKKLITMVALASTTLFFTQKKDGCEELKTQIGNLKVENAELTKQNQYYRETLELNKPLASTTANNLEFSIVSAVGSKKDKTLTISYIYKNTSTEIRKSFHTNTSYFVDVRGNQVETNDAFANSSKNYVENIEPNIPMKGIIKFKIEETDFPIIKLLNLQFFYVGSESFKSLEKITFQNIPVVWK